MIPRYSQIINGLTTVKSNFLFHYKFVEIFIKKNQKQNKKYIYT